MSKQKQLTGILIDPEKKEVSTVGLGTELSDIFDLIDCETFTLVRIGMSDWIYIDDMGLHRHPDDQFFWLCELYPSPYPLVNKGLVLGDGESATYSEQMIRDLVHFPVEKQ